MKEMSMGWRSFLARLAVTAAVLGVVIFAAVRGAMARPGTPGGAARSFVTIAGTVTGVPAGTVPMQFTFRRQVAGDGGLREERCVRSVPVEVDAAGSFAAEVPLDAPAPACEEGFFDGTDVVVDVAVNGTQVVDGGAVNPVPYAIHATTAATATSAATANVANQYGTPDCPVGYTRATDATFTGDMRLCQKRAGMTVVDEVVRVGAGATAFWVDRYEASVWNNLDGTGTQFGLALEDYPMTFPRNGQATAPSYAASRAGVLPSRWITWFQANTACRLAGKRLPLGDEWLMAAMGTEDPARPRSGTDGVCATTSADGVPLRTGDRGQCQSRWGAQDMIGNLLEWTNEWMAESYNGQPTLSDAIVPMPNTSEGGDYHGDAVVGVDPGSVRHYHGVTLGGGGIGDQRVGGAVAAVVRGGSNRLGTAAGVYTYGVNSAPSFWSEQYGFRCVIPR